ncbi:hypothetical protein O181_108531 [Austropuccinia psidii MF-1]|uniref:Reverse transcriptase domain-containing protein n=1 Tax=Austropuccinia psidii MF-1 TaxID=1389203 RepID=A0A9Q3JUY6_9BASI|nr:hypothetical protein [Austropuccinia psidii MF-1]
MSWFLEQKERLTALHPDMSETMIHKRIFTKCGGYIQHAIRRRCIEPFSTEDHIKAMEEITTRTKIGRNWYKPPMDNKTSGKPIARPKKPNDKAPLRCQMWNDSEPFEEEEVPDELSIENINVSFEVTEVHTDLPQYSDECMELKNVKEAKMQKPKPARGQREITVIRQVNNANKERSVSYQLTEAQSSTELTPEIKEELIEISFQYREAFASDNKPLWAIKGYEADIMLNVERPYPQLLRRPASPASSRASKALEIHFDELAKLGVPRNAGHNEEVEVTTPVIITWHNDKSRMVGDFRALNTYTIPDRYPIHIIHETFTQLTKAVFITFMDSLKGFHQNV